MLSLLLKMGTLRVTLICVPPSVLPFLGNTSTMSVQWYRKLYIIIEIDWSITFIFAYVSICVTWYHTSYVYYPECVLSTAHIICGWHTHRHRKQNWNAKAMFRCMKVWWRIFQKCAPLVCELKSFFFLWRVYNILDSILPNCPVNYSIYIETVTIQAAKHIWK